MKVTADRDRCMAAGHCVVTAPAVFDHGEDGLVVLLEPEPGEELRTAVETAEDLCPSRAIVVAAERAEVAGAE
ncbi:ferredoxin [Actinomadura fulvescens]|uniref:Ferredoxin n=1 Tax=Actinomadura fulvescens TaxID=46160 RepID=A0ABN3PI79_9ACTN